MTIVELVKEETEVNLPSFCLNFKLMIPFNKD